MNVKPKFNSLENWKVCIIMKKKKKKKYYIGNFGHVTTAVTQWSSVKKQFLNNSENLRMKKVRKSSVLIRSRSQVIYEIPVSRNKVNIRKMP